MSTIGERLKAERERLKLSQTALGEICRVTKGTQINYEKGDRSPDALYLAAFHAAGGDVMWVVIGDRATPALLPPDEAVLLDHYRASPAELRKAALRVLLGGDLPAPVKTKTKTIKVTGDGNQAAGRDLIHQQGVEIEGSKPAGRRQR